MSKDFEDIWNYTIGEWEKRITNPIFLPRLPKKILTVKEANKGIDKVIFENNHCIIVDTNGDRYIARPEKGEKFDKEKGLLVALAKYCGFTTTKIHNLLEGAIEKNAKSKKPTKKS